MSCICLLSTCSEFLDRPEIFDASPGIDTVGPTAPDAACDIQQCDDGNPCTKPICTPGRAECAYEALPDETPCTDGLYCTTEDRCDAGVCRGNSVTCASIEGGCGIGTCSEATAGCTVELQPDGTPCDDQDGCTLGDACFNGLCTADTMVSCPPLDDGCNVLACNPLSGDCEPQNVADGALCDDDDSCTFSDTCLKGVCTGAPLDCSSWTGECVVGVCDPLTGSCASTSSEDGVSCDDGNLCTDPDICFGGECQGTAVECGDSVAACQGGTCDESTGECTGPIKVDGTACDDGDLCTLVDICEAGACTGSEIIDCSYLDDGCIAGLCDPSSGTCLVGAASNGNWCDDGDPCTENDQCIDGGCTGSPADCSAQDGDCTVGVCTPGGGCESLPATDKDGQPCGTEDPCIAMGSCLGGGCIGLAKDCSSLDDTCILGACDAITGACIAQTLPFGSPCDDQQACTTGEICDGGDCVAYGDVDCSDLTSACELAYCSEDAGGCVVDALVDGTPCDDGSLCTIDESCTSGTCIGTAKNCSALDGACVLGTCVESTGACIGLSLDDGTPCSDGVGCAEGDFCLSGACTSLVDCPCALPARAVSFDGTGCLVTPDHVWVSSSSEFTIEFWLRSVSGDFARLIDGRITEAEGETDWVITYEATLSGVRLRFEYGDLSGNDSTVNSNYLPLNDGEWHHIAVTRADSTMRWWIDGQNSFPQSSTNMGAINSAVGVTVGCSRFGGELFDGSIDDIRVSSFARYVEEFEPPGKHMPDVGTDLLWRFDEGADSTTFKEIMGTGIDFSPLGIVVSELDVAQVFETACCGDGDVQFGEQCDGGEACTMSCDADPLLSLSWQVGNLGCLVIPSPDLTYPPATVTYEFWWYWDGIPGDILQRGNGELGTFRIQVDASGRMVFVAEGTDGSVQLESQAVVLPGAWAHVAFMYAAPSFGRWYVDGVPETAQPLFTSLAEVSSELLLSVSCSDTSAVGLLDSLRISPMIRYTEPFSPVTPLIADISAEVMLTFDQPILPSLDGMDGVRILDGSAYGNDGLAELPSFSEVVP